MSGEGKTEKSLYRRIRALARKESEYAPELWQAVRTVAALPEIAGIENEDERGRAMLRILHKSGADKASKAMRELYFGNTDPRGEGYDNPVRYRLEDIGSAFGYKTVEDLIDGSDGGWSKIPYDRFVEKFGKDADKVRDILRSATHDYFYNVKLPAERKAATHGGAADAITRAFLPRSVEAAERGEDASFKDYALDGLELGLSFLTPEGKVAAGLSRVPKVGRVIDALRMAGKVKFVGPVLRNVPDAAFAPFTMEGVDALAYGDDNEERAEFKLSDPLKSTTYNAMVPLLTKKLIEGGANLAKFLGNLKADKEKAAVEAALEEIAENSQSSKEAAVGVGAEGAEESGKNVWNRVKDWAMRDLAKGSKKKALKKGVPAGLKDVVISGVRRVGMSGAEDLALDKVAIPLVKSGIESIEGDENANREERERNRTSSKASRIMEEAELSDEDRKFLAYIKEHPESVIYGMPVGVDRDRFNTWLMTRGANLRRPGWSVEGKKGG